MIAHSLVEPLGVDVVAFAQCVALDATVFPHPCAIPTITGAASATWIARMETGGPVVGFAATKRDGDRIALIGLAVERTHRGRGLGRALLRATAEASALRGCTVISLCVSVANTQAIALYDAEGFFVTTRIRRYYASAHFAANGDAYEMMKRL